MRIYFPYIMLYWLLVGPCIGIRMEDSNPFPFDPATRDVTLCSYIVYYGLWALTHSSDCSHPQNRQYYTKIRSRSALNRYAYDNGLIDGFLQKGTQAASRWLRSC